MQIITNIRNKRMDITIDPMDIKIIKEQYEQFYAHKFYNIDGRIIRKTQFTKMLTRNG